MSLRPETLSTSRATRKGRLPSRRLDEVLRAGQAHACARDAPPPAAPEPTGVLGPLLSNLPGRTAPPPRPSPGPSRPNMPSMPGEEPGTQNERAYRRAIDKQMVRDKPLKSATVFGVKREGTFTGELVNGKPDGSGELMLPSVVAKVGDDGYTRGEQRVATLKRDGASEEQLREARAEVERLADIPRERYDQAWKSIKAFARSKKRDINLNTLVLWARDNRDQWDLFGAHGAMALNEFRDAYLARVMAEGDQVSMVDGSLKTDGVLTTSEFKGYVDALQRGEIDIVAQRQGLGVQEVETRRWVAGIWYDGYLIDGVVSQEVQPPGSALVNRVDLVTKDTRPLGGTEHTSSLRTETRDAGTLVHKVFVEKTVRAAGAWQLRGKMLWSSRPTAMRFPWAKATEQVKLRNGKGTLGKVNPSYLANANPTLSGYAEVRLTVEATGEHVWLHGEMVNNKLLGEVIVKGSIPGLTLARNDRRIYIDGYDDDSGAPLVRLPRTGEDEEEPPSPPQQDEDNDTNAEDVHEPPWRPRDDSDHVIAVIARNPLLWAILSVGIVAAGRWASGLVSEQVAKVRVARAKAAANAEREKQEERERFVRVRREQAERERLARRSIAPSWVGPARGS